MYSSREVIEKDPIESLFLFHGQIGQSILIIIMPVLVGIFLFRYMQSKSPCDMIHSLPIQRSTLYRSHVVTGIIFLTLPVFFNAIISLILKLTIGLSGVYTIKDVMLWIGVTILMNLIIFFTCVIIGIITGISVVQGVLTYIFLILPLGLILLIGENLKFFLYGFTYNIDRTANKLSPLVRLINGNSFYEMSKTEVLVYIVICVALYFLAKLIYNKRQLESATQAITFPYLQIIFKYGVAFCVMLLSGVYFIKTQSNLYWILFGYLIGSFIGYFLAEMLIKKSIHVFKNIKGFGIYSAIIIVLMVAVKMDVLGYEVYTPKVYDIDSVYFSNSFNSYAYGDENRNKNMDVYYSQDNIENIQLLHGKIIKDKIKNQNLDKKHRLGINVAFMYNLKDGTKVKREYFIKKSDYDEYFKPVYESREYKDMYYGILKVDSQDIQKLTFRKYLNSPYEKEAYIINQQYIKEFVNALKSDIINATYEDMNSNKDAWAGVDVLISNNKLNKYKNIYGYGNKQLYISWEKFEVNAEKVLKETGYLKDSRILPEDISYVLVEKINDTKKFKNRVDGQTLINKNSVNVLKISDKNKIEECLRTYKNMEAEDGGKYIICFYDNKDKSIVYGIYHDNDIPNFIKSNFKL